MSATSFDQGSTGRAPLRSAFGRSLGKWLGIGVALATMAAAVLAFGGPLLGRFWRGFSPLQERTVDRTQPAILQAITDLHDYRAASASFEIVVDVEKDAKWMPSMLRGERKVMVTRGSVDAGVDLSALSQSAIAVDPVTKAVTVTLPHARLRKPSLDLAATKLVVHDRGLLDRLGSAIGKAPSGEQPMLRVAERKLVTAAKKSDVKRRAEANTRAMVTSLVHGLGTEQVTVVFADPPATPQGTSVAGPKVATDL